MRSKDIFNRSKIVHKCCIIVISFLQLPRILRGVWVWGKKEKSFTINFHVQQEFQSKNSNSWYTIHNLLQFFIRNLFRCSVLLFPPPFARAWHDVRNIMSLKRTIRYIPCSVCMLYLNLYKVFVHLLWASTVKLVSVRWVVHFFFRRFGVLGGH